MEMLDHIKKYMEKDRISINKLADLTGMDKTKVYRILRGEQEPKEADLMAFVGGLGLDFAFFYKK
jgi:transcriptional regulator with XRE-family HTH domain